MIIRLVDIDLVNRQLGLNTVESGFIVEQVQVIVTGNTQQSIVNFRPHIAFRRRSAYFLQAAEFIARTDIFPIVDGFAIFETVKRAILPTDRDLCPVRKCVTVCSKRCGSGFTYRDIRTLFSVCRPRIDGQSTGFTSFCHGLVVCTVEGVVRSDSTLEIIAVAVPSCFAVAIHGTELISVPLRLHLSQSQFSDHSVQVHVAAFLGGVVGFRINRHVPIGRDSFPCGRRILAILPAHRFKLTAGNGRRFKNTLSTFVSRIVVCRERLEVAEVQRRCLTVRPIRSGDIHQNITVFSNFTVVPVVYTSKQYALSGTLVDTGQVGNNIFVVTVDLTAVFSIPGKIPGIIFTQNLNRISGIIDIVLSKQNIQVAQYTGNTCRSGDGVGVFQDRNLAGGSVVTEVPTVFVLGLRIVKQRFAVAGKVHMIRVRVPVTGEVLDGLPAFGKGQVINHLIAAVQRIPEAAAVLQSRENLLVVYTAYTDNEVRIFLPILVCSTNFALFTLRNVHYSVGKNGCFTVSSFIGRQVTNLVHQEVAGTGQIEVACAEPCTSGFRVRNGLSGRIIVKAKLGTGDITTCVIDPNRTKRNLRVSMRFGSVYHRSGGNFVREVGRVTELYRRLCLCVGVRLQTDGQLITAVHNTSLAVFAMTATAGQNHRNGIGGQNVARIDVTVIRAHQSIHVPVTVADTRCRVQNVITGRTIVSVRSVCFTLAVRGVTMSVIPRTGVSIHCVVTDADTVASAQEVLDNVIRLTGNVRLFANAYTPTDRVNAVVAFGVNHKLFRIVVKLFNCYRKNGDMLTHMGAVIVEQPSIVGNKIDIVLIHTSGI